MRSDAVSRGDVEAALQQITEVASQVLRVKRASVWVMAADKASIECLNLLHADTMTHEKGAVIAAKDVPRYFGALQGALSIAAHDARTDERTNEFTDSYLIPNGITSMLDAPVLLRGELVGIVCHEHVGPARRWHFWEELLAATLADCVAMVLGASEHVAQTHELARHRAHLEELVAKRTSELERAEVHLRQIFEAAPVALFLTRVKDQAVIDANPRAAALFERSLDELAGIKTVDFWVDLAEREKLMLLVRQRGIVEGFNARLRTATGKEFWAELSLRALLVDGEPCLMAGVRDISEQKALEERLRELATTDGLTGIYNRRHFYEIGHAEVARANRYEGDLSAAMIDVDHFKALNDSHGHAVGDEALRQLAAVARRELRRVDVLARYGGEEFVVLLPQTSAEAARVVLERLRAAVETMPIATPEGEVKMTVSAGVIARRPDESLEAMLRRADDALYRAKAGGRNRVIVDEGQA